MSDEAVLYENQVTELKEQAVSFWDSVQTITVASEEDYLKAGELGGEIKKGLKEIDSHFKPIQQSMDAAKKKVLELRRQVEEPWTKAETHLKSIRQEYRRKLEAEAAAKRKEEEQKRELDFDTTPVAAPVVEIPKSESAQVRKLWRGNIVDPVAFLKWICESPDRQRFVAFQMKEVNSLAVSLKGEVKIPGLEFLTVDSDAFYSK